MQASNRISWIDTMKAFSILMVVLYHTDIMPEIKDLAYILCLPAFFWAAGLFVNTTQSPKAFFRHNTLRLLIPYVVFAILSWFIWMGRNYGQTSEMQAWWKPLWGIVAGNVRLLPQNRPLWFLCCMISLEWIYYLVSRLRQSWLQWIVIACLATIGCLSSAHFDYNVWEIFAACIVLPIYALGAKYKDFFLSYFNNCPLWTLLIILPCSIVGIWMGYTYNPAIKISVCEVQNPFLFYTTLFSVVAFWLSLSGLLDRLFGALRGLQYIGRNTLIILCAHIPLFSIIKGICMICHIPLSFFDTNIGSITLWVTSLICLVPITYIINRYLPFMIGKRKSSTP